MSKSLIIDDISLPGARARCDVAIFSSFCVILPLPAQRLFSNCPIAQHLEQTQQVLINI